MYSYPTSEIVKQFRLSLREGVREFWFTSEDTGAYGLDQGTTLAQLMKELLKIQGDYRIRIGMTNPEHVLRDLENLIRVFQHPNVFKFLHLPIQSGSNRILKLMKREYTKEQFIYIIEAFRKAIPNLTLATDVICGFPTESEAEFKQTLEVIKDTQVSVLNISKFYPRPNTRAAKMKLLNTKLAKARTSKLAAQFRRWNQKQKQTWSNWQGEAFVNEQNHKNWVARNDSYIPIAIHTKKNLFGQRVRVKVKECSIFYLTGMLID